MFDKTKRYIYCASAIKGDTSYRENYETIVQVVQEYYDPAAEIAESMETLENLGILNEKRVYERDIRWLRDSKALVAEMSGASSGVGSEVTTAVRELRIPCLLFHQETANSSLYIRQWRSKYLIHQNYCDMNDLVFYVRCFMNVIRYAEKKDIKQMEKIRILYDHCIKEKTSLLGNTFKQTNDVLERVLELFGSSSRGSEKRTIQTRVCDSNASTHHFPDLGNRVEYKNSIEMVNFFLKALVVQSRWEECTKRQRLGSMFVSGKKERLIVHLPEYVGVTNYAQIYHSHNLDDGDYSKWAFTKNLRAYEKIGLIQSVKPFEDTKSTKFKESRVINTLNGEFKLVPSPIYRKVRPKKTYIHPFALDMSRFVGEFGVKPIQDLIRESKRIDGVKDLTSYDLNLEVNELMVTSEGRKLIKFLNEFCYIFWGRNYSSYVATTRQQGMDPPKNNVHPDCSKE